MNSTDIISDALVDHKISRRKTPLNNELVLDEEWLIEVDSDGAMAATISHIPEVAGNYKGTHRLVVFSSYQNDAEEDSCLRIREEILKVIDEIKDKFAI